MTNTKKGEYKKEMKKELYISPSGNQDGDGTIDRPLKSLIDARKILNKSEEKGGYTIYLRGGDYYVSESILLDAAFSGTKEKPNRITAYKEERVRFLGGILLQKENFRKTTNSAVLERLPVTSREHVYEMALDKIEIDSGVIKQNGHGIPVSVAPMELFYNHKPMVLARYPNNGFIPMGKVIDSGSVPRIGDYSERGGIFEYTDERHSAWKDCSDIWLCGNFSNGYADDMIPVEYIDVQKKQIKLKKPNLYGLKDGKNFLHYYAENILEELDIPGEWYVDREKNVLYFYPPDHWENEIAVSMLEAPLLYIHNASHLIISNLNVEYGRGIGICIEGGDGVILERCTVHNVGTNGIFMGQGAKQIFSHLTHDDYTGIPVSGKVGSYLSQLYTEPLWERGAGKNHIIRNCEICDTGSGGICLSGGSKRNLVNGNNLVLNCKIHDYNRKNKFCWSGVNVDGCGNRISGCEIYNSDYQAIYVRGNNHIFECNNIHHVTQNSDDTSAWYLGRDLSDRGNIIRYNYFHQIGRSDRGNRCIYLDDSTADVYIYSNVFYQCYTVRGLVFCNASRDVRVENNIAIDCPFTFVEMSSYLYTWGRTLWDNLFGENGVVRRRLEAVDYENPPYVIAYPELKGLLDHINNQEVNAMRPANNYMTNNIICFIDSERLKDAKKVTIQNEVGKSLKEQSNYHYSQAVTMWGDYAQFKEENTYIMYEDVGFVDYKNENFNLKPDSVMYKKLKHFKFGWCQSVDSDKHSGDLQ